MTTRHLHPLTSLLLVAAFAHQLGAAPCGCWEHSGWRDLALACLGTPAPDAERAPEPGLPAWDHSECDAAAPLVATPASRGADDLTAAAAEVIACQSVRITGCDVATNGSARQVLDRLSAARVAPPVRASGDVLWL